MPSHYRRLPGSPETFEVTPKEARRIREARQFDPFLGPRTVHERKRFPKGRPKSRPSPLHRFLIRRGFIKGD